MVCKIVRVKLIGIQFGEHEIVKITVTIISWEIIDIWQKNMGGRGNNNKKKQHLDVIQNDFLPSLFGPKQHLRPPSSFVCINLRIFSHLLYPHACPEPGVKYPWSEQPYCIFLVVFIVTCKTFLFKYLYLSSDKTIIKHSLHQNYSLFRVDIVAFWATISPSLRIISSSFFFCFLNLTLQKVFRHFNRQEVLFFRDPGFLSIR